MAEYHVFPSRSVPGEWYAEPRHDEGEESYGALFYGPNAQERAEQYAAWMNHENCGSGRQGASKPHA